MISNKVLSDKMAFVFYSLNRIFSYTQTETNVRLYYCNSSVVWGVLSVSVCSLFDPLSTKTELLIVLS